MIFYFCHMLCNLILTGRRPQEASVRYLVQFSHLLQAPVQSVEENKDIILYIQVSFTQKM
jgi:hypothetical protein